MVTRAVDSPYGTLLASTGIRMATVMLTVLIVKFQRPELGFADFYLWLVVLYLATLAAETVFLGRHATGQQATTLIGHRKEAP